MLNDERLRKRLRCSPSKLSYTRGPAIRLGLQQARRNCAAQSKDSRRDSRCLSRPLAPPELSSGGTALFDIDGA